MATATSQYIKINKLYGMKEGSTTLSAAKAVYGGITPSKRVYKGDEIVYDVWDTTLSANNFTIPASGGSVADYINIVSKMVDINGVTNNINYSISTKTISPNTSTSSKTHTIVITQDLTGESITVTCTQEANTQLGLTYGAPTVVSATTNTIDASGGSTTLTVKYNQSKTISYSNGTSNTVTLTGTTTATSISGSASLSGATKNGVYVEMKSAGTTPYSSARTVYTITGYTFSANGKSKNITGVYIYVKQEANIVEYTTATDGGLNISANPVTVAPLNQRSTITVNCYKNVRDVYTSGAYGEPVKENIEASLSCDTGTFYPKSPIMGGNNTSFIPYENSTNNIIAHIITASVKIGNNTYTDSCIINQDPASYKFEVKEKNLSFDSVGVSDYKISIISSKNGLPLELTNDNISVSGSSGLRYYVVLDDINIEDCRYYLNINLDYNSGSLRTYNITITQPETGNEETITITQTSSTSGGDDTSSVTANVEEAYWLGNEIHYRVTFNGIENYIDYVTVEVNSSPNGDGNIYGNGEVRHDTVLSGDHVVGSILVPGQHYELYIVVRNMSGDVIGYKMVD